MERIEISTAKISLSDIAKHVSRDRVAVELADGQVPLARIVPIEQTYTMAELDRALRASSEMGEDAGDFALDVQSGKESLGKLDDPRES